VVDGCDGELARIRFQESPLGADLDFWGDNLVHLALFSGLAWGFFREGRGAIALVLGAAAVVGSMGSAVLVYLKRLARRRGGAPAPVAGLDGTLSRLEEFLAARDFIYLLLVLAYFDLAYLFLWASALGSIPFFGITMYLGRVKNEQASQPHPPREGEARSPAAGDGGGHQHLHSRR
jgi:phosphatidylglycerophosphate synthase